MLSLNTGAAGSPSVNRQFLSVKARVSWAWLRYSVRDASQYHPEDWHRISSLAAVLCDVVPGYVVRFTRAIPRCPVSQLDLNGNRRTGWHPNLVRV